MSEIRLRREGDPERTARVWQPAEFSHPGGTGGFVARSWGMAPGSGFQPRDLVPRPPEPVEPEPAREALPDEAALGAIPEPEPPAPQEPLIAPGEGWVSLQELEDARHQAYEQGQADGREEVRQAFQNQAREDGQALRAQLRSVEQAVLQLQQRPDELFEPLRRLALHLAEQLVLAELSVSAQAIERLVHRCVDELTSHTQPVQVALHPDDLARLQPWLDQQGAEAEAAHVAPAWALHADDSLLPGSVRVSADDAVVSDLIEHRLDALARQLLLPAQRAASQSAFQRERLAARRAESDTVLDAQPRMADAPRHPRFAPVVEAEASAAPAASEPQDPAPGLEGPHD